MDGPAAGGRAVAEIADIAAMPGTIGQRAEALLEPLARLTRFDAAYLVLLDPECRLVPPLARCGYPERIERFFDSTAMVDDLERIGLQTDRAPMQLKDLPMPALDLPAWAEHLYPAGFAGGIGVPLSTSDGRFIGQFGANTATSAPLPDVTVALLAQLVPLIAFAVDPLRAITTVASMVGHAFAGVVTTDTGTIAALPGLPDHPLLAVDSPVLTAARNRLAHGQTQAVFLCPVAGAAPGTDLVRVTALTCPPQPAVHLGAVVLLSPPTALHGLTTRELRILGMLIEGWPDARTAAALGIPERGVAGHLEDIVSKMAAGSRRVAAVRAMRQGLYLPPGLAGANGPTPPTSEVH